MIDITKLRELARESWGDAGGPDWADYGLGKWYIYCDHDEVDLQIDAAISNQDMGAVYFASEKAAKSAIKTIGADRLKLLLEA